MCAHQIRIDAALGDRLQTVATELGARGLSLESIVHALLLEAASQLEAKRTAQEAQHADEL